MKPGSFFTLAFVIFSAVSRLMFKVSNIQDGAIIPKPKEKHADKKYGEDAFITTPGMIAISDGLGGSHFPAIFISRTIVCKLSKAFVEFWRLNTDKQTLAWSAKGRVETKLLAEGLMTGVGEFNDQLRQIYSKKTKLAFRGKTLTADEVIGASGTLISATIKEDELNPTLKIFQKGDSLLAIFRRFPRHVPSSKGYRYLPVFVTREQQNAFNAPRHIHSSDGLKSQDSIEVQEIPIREGDLVIFGSDGLFDNVPLSVLTFAVNLLIGRTVNGMFTEDIGNEGILDDLAEVIIHKFNVDRSGLEWHSHHKGREDFDVFSVRENFKLFKSASNIKFDAFGNKLLQCKSKTEWMVSENNESIDQEVNKSDQSQIPSLVLIPSEHKRRRKMFKRFKKKPGHIKQVTNIDDQIQELKEVNVDGPNDPDEDDNHFDHQPVDETESNISFEKPRMTGTELKPSQEMVINEPVNHYVIEKKISLRNDEIRKKELFDQSISSSTFSHIDEFMPDLSSEEFESEQKKYKNDRFKHNLHGPNSHSLAQQALEMNYKPSVNFGHAKATQNERFSSQTISREADYNTSFMSKESSSKTPVKDSSTLSRRRILASGGKTDGQDHPSMPDTVKNTQSHLVSKIEIDTNPANIIQDRPPYSAVDRDWNKRFLNKRIEDMNFFNLLASEDILMYEINGGVNHLSSSVINALEKDFMYDIETLREFASVFNAAQFSTALVQLAKKITEHSGYFPSPFHLRSLKYPLQYRQPPRAKPDDITVASGLIVIKGFKKEMYKQLNDDLVAYENETIESLQSAVPPFIDFLRKNPTELCKMIMGQNSCLYLQ